MIKCIFHKFHYFKTGNDEGLVCKVCGLVKRKDDFNESQ